MSDVNSGRRSGKACSIAYKASCQGNVRRCAALSIGLAAKIPNTRHYCLPAHLRPQV